MEPSAPIEAGAGPQLRRSKTDRMIAGVCGGLARYLGIESVVVRIVAVALVFTGAGIPLYILAWILMPEERPGDDVAASTPNRAETSRLFVGGALIALGAVFLIQQAIPWIWKVVWPLVLVAVGAAILVQGTRKSS